MTAPHYPGPVNDTLSKFSSSSAVKNTVAVAASELRGNPFGVAAFAVGIVIVAVEVAATVVGATLVAADARISVFQALDRKSVV